MNGTASYSISGSGNYLFAGDSLYVARSSNNGLSWTTVFVQTYAYRNFVAFSGSTLINGVLSPFNSIGGIYQSSNYGLIWNYRVGRLNVESIQINGNMVFAGLDTHGVYRSSNYGVVWDSTTFNNQSVFSLSINGNYVYAGTSNNGVFASSDNGYNWIQSSLNNQTIWSLTNTGNILYAGSDSGVYYSSDNGSTWVHSSLTNQRIYSLITFLNYVFAGSNGNGLYLSTDFGTSWIQRNEGMIIAPIIKAIYIFNYYIFAGTQQGLIYRRPLGELIGVKPISEEIPIAFALYQNYPNPFNPVTKIKFSIPFLPLGKGEAEGVGVVTLNIYDILGREVATLVNEKLSPGTYEVEWNGSNYSSGIYFYKFSAGEFMETRKMLLVK